MYLLDAPEATIPAFKSAWAALGDSIVVVGGDGLWNCHVHTDEIGGAIEAGIEAGRPRNIRVTDLLEQVEEEGWVAQAEAAPPVVHAPAGLGRDRGGRGRGWRRRAAAPREPRRAGDRRGRSIDEPVDGADPRGGRALPVGLGDRLPNNKNIVAVARQVDELTDKSVAVVPTHSVLEALSALLGYDPDAELPTNVTELAGAVARTAAGEVTQSVRDTVVDGVPIRKGDWIAITREGICRRDRLSRRCRVRAHRRAGRRRHRDRDGARRLGRARHGDTQRVREHLSHRHPGIEIEVHDGGQPLYPYLIGVE